MDLPEALLHRMITEGFWSDTLRVWLTILAHTNIEKTDFGLGVARIGEQFLTRADVSQLTALNPSRVRRAVAALEKSGYVERRRANHWAKALTRGNVVFYVTALPAVPTAPPGPSA